MKNYDYALEYDLIFSGSRLEYYSKEGELMAYTPYDIYPYYDSYMSEGWILLKKSLIYLETMELYLKIKKVLMPDLTEYCILTYCDMLNDEFPRNVRIK